jgi:hypothetical protein
MEFELIDVGKDVLDDYFVEGKVHFGVGYGQL